MKSLIDYLTSDGKYPERAKKAADRVKSIASYLLRCVRDLLQEIEITTYVINSGYRDPDSNAAAGGSPNSAHITGEAIDIKDDNGEIASKITPELLKKHNVYMEHPSKTPGWIHLTTRAPKSGKRIFYP